MMAKDSLNSSLTLTTLPHLMLQDFSTYLNDKSLFCFGLINKFCKNLAIAELTNREVKLKKERASAELIKFQNQFFLSSKNNPLMLRDGFIQYIFEDTLNERPIQNFEIIQEFVSDRDSIYILTGDGKLGVIGQNYHGQLGLGPNNDVDTVTMVPEFTDQAIKQIFYSRARHQLSQMRDDAR